MLNVIDNNGFILDSVLDQFNSDPIETQPILPSPTQSSNPPKVCHVTFLHTIIDYMLLLISSGFKVLILNEKQTSMYMRHLVLFLTIDVDC